MQANEISVNRQFGGMGKVGLKGAISVMSDSTVL